MCKIYVLEGLMEEENVVEQAAMRNSMITVFRGNTFVSNLRKLLESKQALKNIELLSQRTCQIDVNSVSYRTLHHWDSVGLIECGRESSKAGWRKFNLVETLWLHVIIKFRDMGISLEKIGKAKSLFFEKIPGLDLKYAEYYVVGALYFKTPSFFVTPPDGPSEFLSYEEMIGAMEVGLLDNAILIHLNPLLNKIFKKIEVESDFAFKRSVTDEQNTICDLLDKEDFDSLKISKTNGKISDVEFEKGFSRQTPYHEIVRDETDAIISTRISDGIVASRKRVKRVKLD